MENKIICLIDMDCFYVQVEQIAAPEFLGQPCGVKFNQKKTNYLMI
jgi:nucleotidyltransferase/DNA polymerase involved in DNA repair